MPLDHNGVLPIKENLIRQNYLLILMKYLVEGNTDKNNNKPICGIMVEVIRLSLLTYTGFIRLTAYDPQVLLLLTSCYFIELFAYSTPLLILALNNDRQIKAIAGDTFSSNNYISHLTIASSCMLLASILLELGILFKLQERVSQIDW